MIYKDIFLYCRTYMKEFDYFRKQKESALTSTFETISFVTQHVSDFFDTKTTNNQLDNTELSTFFIKMLKVG